MQEPDRTKALALVRRMLAIPGPSGKEGLIVGFVRDRLIEAGLSASAIDIDTAHRRSPLGGEVGNLIVRLAGTKPGPRRLLVGHLDTVPLCVGCRPVHRAGKLVARDPSTGLGADNRAGAAAIVTALVEMLRQKLPHPPITFLWPVQEEVGILGVRHLSIGLLGRPVMGFNFDGGAPAKVTIGATGADRMTIDITGKAAHAGVRPEAGVSAITIAGLAIARLQRAGWLGAIRKRAGRGTSNIGVIDAGQATNVVTDRARLRAEARSHDRAFRETILAAYQSTFTDAAHEVHNTAGETGKVAIDVRLDYEAFRLADNEPSIAIAISAARAVGLEPVRVIADGGLDANWLVARGIPTVSLGAGQQNAHTTAEALDLDQFHAACRLALRLATGV